MPAVTLVQRTIHSRKNCGVFQAVATLTLCVEMSADCLLAVQPSGFQTGAGDSDGEDSVHHEDEIEDAHGDEGHGDHGLAVGLEVGHEVSGVWAADHRAS